VARAGNSVSGNNGYNVYQEDPWGFEESNRETENSSDANGGRRQEWLFFAMVEVEGNGAEYGSNNEETYCPRN